MEFPSRISPRVLDIPIIGKALSDADKASANGLGMILKRYPAHTIITREGDGEDRIFFVSSGWSCIYTDLLSGERQIIDFPAGGDVIGLRTRRSPSRVSFKSITELTVFEMAAKALTSASEHSPTLASRLLSVAARQRAILIEHLTNIGRRSGAERVAHLLLEMGARQHYGQIANINAYECPLTQHDLADALGLTAIHVNRVLKELRQLGLLSFQHRIVEILDLNEIINLTDFSLSYLKYDDFA
ncbi:Crp/Fnr family transcriptional regulator (plasmid) [Mesorhizobium sp. AaZ16]|uniref:Crp/Fnr family transcriptional regulator n=1 Tax=Mesorhizobium sp. AaZ16 TaxID=3402289 RepID=UPI00374E9E46